MKIPKTLMLLLSIGLVFILGARSQNVRSRVSNDWRPRSTGSTCSVTNCKLPDCYCPGRTGPSHLRNQEIPQMVMLTFDDGINEEVFEFYKKLLRQDRHNPNGCAISATFYLSHNWTNYDMVRELYKSGHEIASHSITHRLPQSWWTHAKLKDWYKEINGQKKNIVSKAKVSSGDVKGMRVPFLELGGDKQFTMVRDTGLKYDSSFMTGPFDEGGAWPFTLEFPPNWIYCSNNNCPKSSFPGIWELPMNRWIGPDGKPCSMVDACQTQPVDKEDALGYIWYNFNRFYRGNRAPFGIHLHAEWFKRDPSFFDGVDTFIDALSDMDDVYFVTASQIIEWMENPTSVKDIVKFAPWKRSCTSQNRVLGESLPPQPKLTTTESPKQKTQTTTTQRIPTLEPLTEPTTKKNGPVINVEISKTTPNTRQSVDRRGHSNWQPEYVSNRNEGWNANAPTHRTESNRPVYQGPPHRENFYPSRHDQPRDNRAPPQNGQPGDARIRPSETFDGNGIVNQESLAREPINVLREEIDVKIDIENSEPMPKEKANVESAPNNNKVDVNTSKAGTQVKNAYGSSKRDVSTADRPLSQSSSSANSYRMVYSYLFITILVVLKS